MPLIWGLIISEALFPVFLKLKGWLKGRESLAGTVAALGGGMVQTIFALIIAGVLMMNAQAAAG